MDFEMKATRPEAPGLSDSRFISHLSSSQQLSKLEASRLEIHWKKICDLEKKSKERNKELLRDFERVEQHASVLAAKSERLKVYKQQYENYINKMYPRWKEELENNRLRKLQSRSDAVTGKETRQAPPRHMVLPSQTTRLETSPIHDPLLSSTLAHPSKSPPNHNGFLYNQSPPEASLHSGNLHRSHLQDPYGEYRHERQSESYSLRDNLQHTGYAQQPNSGWQMLRNAGPQRNVDNRGYVSQPGLHHPMSGDLYQGQFASNGMEHANVYHRPPDPYAPQSSYVMSSGPYQDRHPPSVDHPIRAPQDARYGYSGAHPGQIQGARPAAPYEPRTELQKSLLSRDDGGGGYDLGGRGPGYFDERRGHHGDYRDQWHAGLVDERHRVQREISDKENAAAADKKFESSLPERPTLPYDQQLVKASTRPLQGTIQTKQPYAPPEKPLERHVPVSSFSDPSLSSSTIETPVERKNVRLKEDEYVTSPETSPRPKEVVTDTPQIATGRPEVAVTTNHTLSITQVQQATPARELQSEPVESPVSSEEPTQGILGLAFGRKEPEIHHTPEVHLQLEVQHTPEVPHTPEVSNKLQDAGLDDEEESLDLSDLSLPDGGNVDGPPDLQKEENRESVKLGGADAFKKEVDVAMETSKPSVVADSAKSVTEEIGEDILESQDLEEIVSDFELPVKEQTVSSDGAQPKVAEDVENAANEIKKQSATTDEPESKKLEEKRELSGTVDGFLSLLHAVDADVEVSFSPETLYHSPECSSDMKTEIIRTAELGSSLQSFDPNTISMIVLEELPLLVTSSLAGCLIPDKVFSEGVTCGSEKELRPYVELSLLKLWKTLFSHLVSVVINNVMNAEEAGNLFGSLLLARDSKHGKQSEILLRTILEYEISDDRFHSPSPPESPAAHDVYLEPRFETEALPQDDDKVSIASESSNSTLGSTPPKNEAIKPNPEEIRKPTPDPTVSYEEDFEDEEVPLTETAAYRKLMSSAHSEPDDDISDILVESGQSKPHNEANEEVEKVLARAISPPAVTSPRQKSPAQSKGGKQRPKLSLFESGGENMADILGDSWGGSSLQSGKSEMSDSESMISPPLSPDDGAGYVPSALHLNEQDIGEKNRVEAEDNEKSEAKSLNDSKAKRKTDFWNNSDTESEVDLQLSTGGVDEEDDDFDFYG